VILSGVMMFQTMGWKEAALLVEAALAETIRQKKVTYDLERLMEGASKLKTSEFAAAIIGNMDSIRNGARTGALAGVTS
jgi:isocitrate dehydrogenase